MKTFLLCLVILSLTIFAAGVEAKVPKRRQNRLNLYKRWASVYHRDYKRHIHNTRLRGVDHRLWNKYTKLAKGGKRTPAWKKYAMLRNYNLSMWRKALHKKRTTANRKEIRTYYKKYLHYLGKLHRKSYAKRRVLHRRRFGKGLWNRRLNLYKRLVKSYGKRKGAYWKRLTSIYKKREANARKYLARFKKGSKKLSKHIRSTYYLWHNRARTALR